MPKRLKQKDLKEGDHVYMVGIEGITSITIITIPSLESITQDQSSAISITVVTTQKTLPIMETITVQTTKIGSITTVGYMLDMMKLQKHSSIVKQTTQDHSSPLQPALNHSKLNKVCN